MNPPMGILKLNFDGNFICSSRRGGGVVRCWAGTVVCSYSGPLESSDADEVAVFAPLVGCRELRSMGCVNAIIEDDSFSAIQWGLHNSSFPWRLADWGGGAGYFASVKCLGSPYFKSKCARPQPLISVISAI